MTYRIAGLDPARLDVRNAIRMTVDTRPGYPCRVTLEDADPGEAMLLVHHVSHDVATPFRSAYAIFVRESAARAAEMVDRVPAFFSHRTLGLRGFDAAGMLHAAALAGPGEADTRLLELLASPAIAYVDLHNAAAGCFLARATRHD